MTDDIQKYKYEEISNKVLRTDKRLLDTGAFADSVDTNPHSIKGRVTAEDFGSNIRPADIQRDAEEQEEIVKSIESSSAIQKTLKDKRRRRNFAKNSSSVLDTDIIDTLNYTPTTESNVNIYNQIIEWCSKKLDNDLPDDVINSLADIIIESLKSSEPNSLVKKKQVEEVLKQKVSDDEFLKLYSLVNSISDYQQSFESNGDDGLGLIIDSDGDQSDDESDDDDVDYSSNDSEHNEGNDSQADQELLNQDVDDTDNVVRLVTNNDEEEQEDYKSIDKYWLNRQLSKFQPQIDSYKYADISKQIYEQLELLNTGKTDLRSFEREITSIPDFEADEFVHDLIKNHKKIYYALRLSKEDDENVRTRILAILESLVPRNTGKRALDSKESEDPLKRQKIVNSGVVQSIPVNKYPRNIDINSLVFTQGSKLMTVSKFELPKGSFKRTRRSWEEIHIPAPEKAKQAPDEVLVSISELPEWARPVFPSGEMSMLNRIQSKVYPSAFNDDCNILMCAPTGAGKTNVAMLTILRTISNFRNVNGKIQLHNFKIVYIAPLKALVQEQVREFDRRLSPLGIKVEELTGDSNLTRHQIESTQILVTTPEKWDVITRKNNDASYINLVRLIIIDEIHLLHDERGPVLECIVSRTMKNMDDNAENKVRFVGLSATLPNYKDVAEFLRVEEHGLFYFDASYRPCPLAQQFIGITEKKAFRKYEAMNEICYEKMIDNLSENNQMIIFVHSRKETAKTAKWLANKLLEEEKLSSSMKFSSGVREILKTEADNASNKGLKYVLPMGFGIHHAGMNRNDRQTTEDLFAEGHIKVLVSTATLAWGVNLPAHTVIIKGTSVYSPEKGTWVDLSPQDILQMLGRAGRPRYDTHGDGIIITSQDQIKYYLAILNQQLPIESQMYAKLADSINAEVVAGSIRSLKDCISWMGYTYLYVRMLHSRDIYFVGPLYENDLELRERRRDLGYSALLILAKNGLIKYNFSKDTIIPTPLGKIASYYYISHKNVKNFEEQLKPHFSEIELFRLFAGAEEFKFVPVRREEKVELQKLVEKAPIPINEDVEDPLSKINVLLQAYISDLKLDGFALMADMIFISQSAGRLFRALFDLALTKGWAKLSRILSNICKMIEKKLWLTSTPLRQYPDVPSELINVAEKSLTPWEYYLALTDSSAIIKSLKAEKFGNLAPELIKKFPRVDIDYDLQPITPSLLQISLDITPRWKWDVSLHGFTESFTLVLEDCDGEKLLYIDRFVVHKDRINETHSLSFTVPIFEVAQPNYFISMISDKWLFCETRIPAILTSLTIPQKFPPPTPLIDFTVPITELGVKEFASVFPFEFFNKFQSQVFDAVYSGEENVLLSCSKGNGKTTIAILAILGHWKNNGGRAVYISPNQSSINLFLRKWKKKLSKLAGGKVINKLSGDLNMDLQILSQSHLIICTPAQIEAVSRRWQQRKSIQSIELIVADDCHTIGSGHQGTLYESLINRFRYIATNLDKNLRFLMLCSSIASYKDFADWIDIPKKNLFVFDPRERVCPLEVKFSYIDIPHNPSLLKCLIRPSFKAISDMNHRMGEETCLVFLPERKNLIEFSKSYVQKLQLDGNNWLRTDESSIESFLSSVQDPVLKASLKFGIGFCHEWMAAVDQKIVLNLFDAGALKCMLATKDASRWCPFANMVIVLGTQDYDGREHRYVDYTIDDMLEMISLARINEKTISKSLVFTNSPKLDYYKRFVALSLPLESHLNNFIHDALIGDINIIKNRQYAVDWITYSLFYRRLQLNPSFYKLNDTSEDGLSEYLSELIEKTLGDLESAGLIELTIEDENNEPETTDRDDDFDDTEKDEIIPLNGSLIANYYGVTYSTIELLGQLNEKARLKKILEVVCLVNEYEDLPLRDDEKTLLFQMYNSVPLKWSFDVDFESQSLKIFILLQAYFSRFPLKPDHLIDLNQILPNAIKVLYACVDILSSKGYLNAMLAMDLCQMISQGLWNSDNPLKQIPFFNNEIIEKCKKQKIDSVYDIMELDDNVREQILEGLSEKEVSDVASFVNKYPNLEITYHLEGDVVAGEGKDIEIEINRDEEVEDLSIVSSSFPVKKFENWWIVIGNTTNNELYSIRKLTINKESQKVKMNFTIPEAGKQDVFIWCVCDSYLEADKQVQIRDLDVKNE